MAAPPRPLRILHLEDDPADAALVAETLRAERVDCEIVNVQRRDTFEAALDRDTFDLILADYHLPSFDGLTAQAIAAERQPLVPFIFVSGTLGEDIAVERMKSGALDYVLKQRLSRLPSSVRRAIRESEAAAERGRAEAEVRRLNAELEQRVVERTAQLLEASRTVEAREHELRQAKSLLEDLLAASPSIVFRIDPSDFTITYASPNVGWMLGYAPDEIVGVRNFWRRLFHADDLDRAMGHLRDALEACSVHVEQEYRLCGKDGRYRWFFSLMRIEYDDRGRPATILWYCGDISDRRAAEQALLETEEHTRAILRTANDAFIRMDSAGRIVEWNECAERMFGWSREEAIGRILSDTIIPEGHRDAHRRGLSTYRGTGHASVVNERMELRALRRDGVEFPVELTIWLSGGAGQTYNAFVRDITERRRADQAIRQAKEDAERANQAKSEFLSRMSHDLRTPLNAVLGFAQFLDSEPLSSDQRDCVRQILSGGHLLLELINEVLDIARIESGHIGLSMEAVQLAGVVTRTAELIAPLAAQRGVTLDVDQRFLRGDRAAVVADRQRLNQILLNLLSNAVKYNQPNGRVTVTLDAPRPEVWRIRITDMGAGIAASKLPMLFTPFERLGAEKTGVEGTGLGLAVSQRLAAAMHGSLGVDSAIGVGSTFWLELPAAAEAAAAPGAAAAPARPPEVRGQSRTLLYIEDNVSNVRLMTRVLSRRPNLTLLHAGLGREGLAIARAQHPDLVILDLNLPDVSGDVILREIRGDAELQHTPVLVLSADATRARSESLAAAGATMHLAKPFAIEALLTALDRLLMPTIAEAV